MIVKPLVIGIPRSGFSLLIYVINSTMNALNIKPQQTYQDMIIRQLITFASAYITDRYQQAFAQHGITKDLVFNGEFHLLVGGPKWLNQENPALASFRKYLGVRGMGDFLLITNHPKEVLEYYPVVHSHTAPQFWLKQPYYEAFQKFTSLRNPIGIINSASFSLNAMASEYIQKFMPDSSEDFLRQRMGLYKLTDLNVVEGLTKFLKNYMDEFLLVRDKYFTMKWEDLILSPIETIKHVATGLGMKLSDDIAEKIWKPMDHVNLLLHHKHNYRRGKGIVGDWKNSLVNEHMEIFRKYDFDKYMDALGYPPVPELDPRDYSPYQKLIVRYIQRGEIYQNTGDPDLFGFAFNKSNIDASKFNFKTFPKRKWTHVERSTLPDDSVVEAVSDAAEDACEKINCLLFEVISADLQTKNNALKLINSLEKRSQELVNEISNGKGQTLYHQVFQSLYSQIN
jgi:hypothetical protein